MSEESKTEGPVAPAAGQMGADPAAENIDRSIELIVKLRQTTQASKRILQQARVFYETNKMLESSKKLSASTQEQLRRRR